jgi:ribokinase
LKTGSRGCFLFDREGVTGVSGFQCDPVMSATRCDDAFAGAFAASLGSGDDVSVAVKFASAAGAVASRKFSGQDTMPSKEEIIELLQNESD